MQRLVLLFSAALLILTTEFTSVVRSQSLRQHIVRNCPGGYVQIGKKCYYFSIDTANFNEAHYNCLSRNSTLAVLSKPTQEKKLRSYLRKHEKVLGRFERWIGASYDWGQKQWTWSASGKPVVYNAFNKMNHCKDWSWYCVIVDPEKDNLWSAKRCYDEIPYICQTKGSNIVLENKRWKKDFNVSRCNESNLGQDEIRRCTKLLGGDYKNKSSPSDPGQLMRPPRRKPGKILTCPSHMILLGNKCYYFSTEVESFHGAHFFCIENNTRVAVIRSPGQNKLLKQFLNSNFIEHKERWIDGIYDWKKNRWKWFNNGKEIKYRDFIPSVMPNRDLRWMGIVMDPLYNHQWNVKDISMKKHFICQTKAKTVPYKGVTSNDLFRNNEPLPRRKAPLHRKSQYKKNYL